MKKLKLSVETGQVQGASCGSQFIQRLGHGRDSSAPEEESNMAPPGRESTGSNRNVVGRFMYAGRVWGVQGDTRLDPIRRAYDALVDGRVRDPFVIKRTLKNVRDCLDLVPQLKVSKQPKHFYVYA